MKHLEVKQLWLQEQVCSGKVVFKKVSSQKQPCKEALQAHELRVIEPEAAEATFSGSWPMEFREP